MLTGKHGARFSLFLLIVSLTLFQRRHITRGPFERQAFQKTSQGSLRLSTIVLGFMNKFFASEHRSELVSHWRLSKKSLLKTILAQLNQSHPCMSRHQPFLCIFKFCIFSHPSVIFRKEHETLSSNKCLRPINPTLQIKNTTTFVVCEVAF